MNESTENECLPNLEMFKNLRKPLTRKSTRENALTLTLKGFPLFAHWRGSEKKKTFRLAQVALAMRFKKNSLPDE